MKLSVKIVMSNKIVKMKIKVNNKVKINKCPMKILKLNRNMKNIATLPNSAPPPFLCFAIFFCS